MSNCRKKNFDEKYILGEKKCSQNWDCLFLVFVVGLSLETELCKNLLQSQKFAKKGGRHFRLLRLS
jgi:hypothetical protein